MLVQDDTSLDTRRRECLEMKHTMIVLVGELVSQLKITYDRLSLVVLFCTNQPIIQIKTMTIENFLGCLCFVSTNNNEKNEVIQ